MKTIEIFQRVKYIRNNEYDKHLEEWEKNVYLLSSPKRLFINNNIFQG